VKDRDLQRERERERVTERWRKQEILIKIDEARDI
jgi:hypothetical protein